MSQYTHFFIRTPDDKFLPIACYSRSHTIAETFRNAPWEKITAISQDQLLYARQRIRELIDSYKEDIAQYESQIELITKMDNSVDDKLEQIHSTQNYIKEINETINDLDEAMMFCRFLDNILDAADDAKYWGVDGEPDPGYRLNPNAYLYYGCECGDCPTLDDVVY